MTAQHAGHVLASLGVVELRVTLSLSVAKGGTVLGSGTIGFSQCGSKKVACACDVPVTSVIDDGLDDEFASIIIVGGGPHALAALAALLDGSLASQQAGSGGSLQKVGTGARCSFCVNPLASHISPH